MKKLALFASLLAMLATPALAQSSRINSVPLPTPKPASAPATPAKAPTKKTLDPLAFLRQIQGFAVDDLNNAITEATANNNKITRPCWQFLLPLAQGTSTNNPLPDQFGVATAVETAFDDQQIIANWLVPNGTLDQLTIACAPMVTKANATFIAGGAAIATAIAGGPGTSGALLSGLTLLLSGQTALTALIP